MIPTLLQDCIVDFKNLEGLLKISDVSAQISHIDEIISNPDFWTNPDKEKLKTREKLQKLFTSYTTITNSLEYYKELSEIENLDLYKSEIEILYNNISSLLISQAMSGKNDDCDCLLTISAGAGGLEAENWTNILLRMYLRYCKAQNFTVEIIDEERAKEHSSDCLNQVSLRIVGKFAYGMLKYEHGVHRLIRNSPYNANNARQTSFAGVAVYPDIEQNIEIKIEDKDLEISTMRASGSGGQAVNKIESAVRIKHLPTGIVINSRGESSQHANRNSAMKMLKAKLFAYEENKLKNEHDNLMEQQTNNSFGSQVRSYVLSPFSLVSDHRSDYKVNNAQSVLDGNLTKIHWSIIRNNGDK